MAGQVISRLTSSGGNDAGVHVISSSFYGTCSSAANSENKEIIIQNRNVEQVNLTKGMLLTVKFTNKNDYSESLPSLQLFKNEAAPDSIPIIGSALTTPMTIFAQQNSNIKPNWSAGSVVTFIYDTYIKQNQDGTTSTLGCWIKTAGLSEEVFNNLNIRIDGVESASTIAINGVADRVDSIESNITQAAVVGDIEFIYWPIDSTTTPPVTPAASYDWEETFNVNCEWSTDALPYVFGLDIWQRTKSFTIGNASNPTYSDPIRITGRDGAKGDKGDQGEPGTTGSPAYSYSIISNITSMTRDVNVTPHVNNPSTITFSATKTEGNNNPTSYRGQLQISQYINNQWSSLRSKALMESDSITITPSNEATLVRGILFTIDGNTQLDSQTVSIIETGLNGENGKNAAIAYLTNESHGFAATSSAAITASVSSQFIINQDGQELNTTITNITYDQLTNQIIQAGGLATTYSGNTFTVSVNPAFTTTFSHQGTLSVSATASVNGSSQSFTKDFSWSLVPAGVDGENGINTANVKLYKIAINTPGKPQGDVTYNFNTQTVTANDGVLNGWSISVPDMSTATAGVSCYLISANVLTSANQNTDVITENEWYGPIVYTKNGRNGEPGSAGYNQATISLHQRYNPTEQNLIPSKPGDNTYNFTTGEFTSIDALGNWSKEAEAASNGEPDWITSVNLISQATSTSVTSAQWSTPVIFTRDGAAGLNAYLYEVQCNPSVIMFDQNVENPAFSPTAITLSATKTEGNNSPESCEGYFKLEYTNDNQTWTSIYTSAQAESTLNCSITPQYIPTPTNVTQLRASLYKTNNMTVTPIDFEDIPVIRSGLNGTNGINGYNQASVFLYQRSANQPTNKPTDNLIYTFANRTLTPTNKYTPTWTLNQIPAATDQNSNPAWMISAIASSTATTDTITTNEWSTPIKIEGVDGEDGYNQTIVSLYQRASSAPQTKPTVTAYYTFTDNTITTSPTDGLAGWSLNIPTGPNPCWTISALARSQTNTATIESNTWSDVSKFVEDGKSGYNNATIYIYQRADSSPSVPNTNLTYTFDSCSLNLPQGSSWSQEIPEKTEQNNGILWMTTAVANSTAATDTIASTDWGEVIQLEGVNGVPGQAGYNQATIQLYQRANSSPNVPSNSLTYTFNSNSLTPKDSGSTDTTPTYQGWYRQIPAVNGQPCWVTSGTAISRDSSAIISNWNTPTKILEDSVNVIIDNDNVTFPTTNGAAAKTTVTCSIKAFKGLTQVPCTIESISGTVTGIATSKINGTTTTPTAKITITASNTTSTLLTTEQGTLTIPVTVSGVTNSINKQFTWSLAKNGLNQATVYLYKRATSNPGKPGPAENPQDSEYATYTFSGNNSGLSIPESWSSNNWSTIFPTVEQGVTTPVWVSTAIASSNTNTDDIPRSEWSTATQWISNGANGQDGYNQATISLYKRSINEPSKPSSNLTYTFANGISSTLNLNDWRGSVTAATVTNGTDQNDYMPCWITSTSPISTETSVTINEGNWSDPTIFIQPGKGIASVTNYYLATDLLTGVDITTSGWQNNPPSLSSTNPYLWNYEATTYTDTNTRVIAPRIIATYDTGRSITSITNYYQTTTAANAPSSRYESATVTNGWSTEVVQINSENKFLWKYEKIIYTNGDPTITDIHLIGAYGDNGAGVNDIIEQAILWDYNDNEHAPGNDEEWQLEKSVVWQSGKYIWTRTKIIWSDGNITYAGPVLAENDNNIGENIDNISNRSVAYSGTCSSSTSAAAKVVTCTNFPTLAAGVTITVRFSNANTVSSALTLNVNSTGAKTIYVNGASTSSSNQLLWAANANISFTYDGTYWRVNSEPRSWYGTCSTGASTAPKTTSINEAVICKGTNVTLNMTNTNTNASATLNVSSTGAKNIYYGTTTTRPTTGDNGNGYGWTAASTVTFVFDGQNWRLGDTSALAGVIKAASDLGTYILSNNIAIQNLQDQIDDQLEIWYGTIDPTISSEPASNWDTNDLKEAHIGDMYYNTTNGKVFQWIKENDTYKWNEIEDEAAANALEAAQNAQSTADGRCKVFIAEEDADSATGWSEPIPPYDVGDIWILGTEIWYAKNKKNENEVFDISDWELSAKDNDSTIEELSKQFIVSTIQLWYACNDDNFSNIPLNFVNIDSDTSDEIYEQWTSKIPLYNKQYPYYYYCYQYQFSDGTYKWSDVVQDISKTEYMNYLQTLENIVENTKTTLNKINQHFYADDYGAHVIATDGDLNTLWNSTGLLFQDSTIPLLHLGSRNNIGLTIYDGLGDSEENIVSSFIKDKIQLGSMLSNDSLYITITPAQMTFWNNDKQLAYAAGNNFYMPNATVNSALNLNNWAWIPRSNGNLSLKWMG